MDFRRLLHIGPEVAANLLQEPAYRMPYIHGDKKRAEYGAGIQAALEVAGIGEMLDEADGVLLKLQQAREAERRVLNRPRDREQWLPCTDARWEVNSVTGARREAKLSGDPVPDADEEGERVSALEAEMLAILDTVDGAVQAALREKREAAAARLSGRRYT